MDSSGNSGGRGFINENEKEQTRHLRLFLDY